MNINEGNKLIALFMGFEKFNHRGEEAKGNIIEIFRFLPVNDIGYPQGTFRIGQLKYHSSWDWLMPVVEKIRDIEDMGTIKNALDYVCSTGKIKDWNNINDVWNAIVKYLGRYNYQVKQLTPLK